MRSTYRQFCCELPAIRQKCALPRISFACDKASLEKIFQDSPPDLKVFTERIAGMDDPFSTVRFRVTVPQCCRPVALRDFFCQAFVESMLFGMRTATAFARTVTVSPADTDNSTIAFLGLRSVTRPLMTSSAPKGVGFRYSIWSTAVTKRGAMLSAISEDAAVAIA